MQTKEKTYNGWSNYETWAVNLWMTNDEGSYRYWVAETLGVMERHGDPADQKYQLSGILKDYFEENNPLPNSGVYTDLLNAAMSEVNWYEVAEALIADNTETQ